MGRIAVAPNFSLVIRIIIITKRVTKHLQFLLRIFPPDPPFASALSPSIANRHHALGSPRVRGDVRHRRPGRRPLGSARGGGRLVRGRVKEQGGRLQASYCHLFLNYIQDGDFNFLLLLDLVKAGCSLTAPTRGGPRPGTTGTGRSEPSTWQVGRHRN